MDHAIKLIKQIYPKVSDSQIPIAYSGAKLWTEILFGEITKTSVLVTYWSNAFYYLFMLLIFIVPAIGIYAVVLNQDEEVSLRT